MTTNACLTSASDAVKTAVSSLLEPGIGSLMAAAEGGASARELELDTLKLANEMARLILSVALARRNRRAMEEDIEERKLPADRVSVRLDASYWMSLTTTVGPIRVPMFAYRDTSHALAVTRSPARKVFPLYPKCRSTEVCLEWESRLAGQQPFRKAQEMLTYFTHGCVELEDTTIERHAIRIAHLIEQKWLYRPRTDLVRILTERATVDRMTGRPILYCSCDAHALRRFINESWTAEWKMMNGLRLWCVDRKTNSIIHLGGEFTCGDARYLRQRLLDLLEAGIIPANADFGDGLVAQYVFVADGMPWFEQHIIPLLPNAVVILDAYHLMEHLAAFAKKLCQRHHDSDEVYRQMLDTLFGPKPRQRAEPQHERKGHSKRPRDRPPDASPGSLKRQPHTNIKALVTLLNGLNVKGGAKHKLLAYIEANAYRMDYRAYRARGFQIGSGAMESIHRTGSQERLKRPGARWLPETLEGMFRLRMLEIVGRWHEWWTQPGFFAANADRFVDTVYRTRTGPVARRPNAA